MKTINPATGKILREYPDMTPDEVNDIIESANKAQKVWKQTANQERAEILRNVATLLRNQEMSLGILMTMEMGKPLSQSASELEKCAWVCEYYANHSIEFLSNEIICTDASKSYVTFNPLGIILSIMPWNFPCWQVFRFAAPALMAGNGVVLSHSENTTGTALKIEEIIHEAGVPKELFRTILVPDAKMKGVIQHPGIAAVTLTGSTRAGKIVASQAGEVLKKTVLELGGSDPYLIFADADIEEAVDACVHSRLLNSGQSCIAAKRFVVVEEVYELFMEKFRHQMKVKRVGDPIEASTNIGPMARKDLRDELHKQVQLSIKKGAKLTLGGVLPEGEGAFYPVTILEEVTKGMPAYEEELFGPVAAVIKVKNEKEAIAVANDTSYGLGAAIFSKDKRKAERLAAEELEAGCCFVNDFVKSDPRLPFGGVKDSGYGRELGLYGIREFVNTKTVWVK